MAVKAWKCSSCGHVVISREQPEPIKWTDGHTCHFVENREYFNMDDLIDIPPPPKTIFYHRDEDEQS